MSIESHRQEADRWARQAEADFRAAEASRAAGSFEWACFQCQQAAEKALKAVWHWRGLDPWGHSVLKLIDDLPDAQARTELMAFAAQARALDRLYIPTRYPNGLPGLTPTEAFADQEAQEALEAARAVLDACRRHRSA